MFSDFEKGFSCVFSGVTSRHPTTCCMSSIAERRSKYMRVFANLVFQLHTLTCSYSILCLPPLISHTHSTCFDHVACNVVHTRVRSDVSHSALDARVEGVVRDRRHRSRHPAHCWCLPEESEVSCAVCFACIKAYVNSYSMASSLKGLANWLQ